ncbi:InlB B-repeat-containing protein [Treponema sp. R6D11]
MVFSFGVLARKKIKVFIPIICIFFALLVACELENPWMAEVLEEKTITFNSNGGTPVPSQKLIAGERVKRPQNPTKRNADTEPMTFSGWYTDNETFDQLYDFDFVPQTDMTLYAKWSEGTGGTTTEPYIFIDGIDKLVAYLNALPANTETNPAKIKLNITDDDFGTLKYILQDTDKYVSLDLSDSSIETIPSEAFLDYALFQEGYISRLVGIIIPDIRKIARFT